jgi:hypothetical protein
MRWMDSDAHKEPGTFTDFWSSRMVNNVAASPFGAFSTQIALELELAGSLRMDALIVAQNRAGGDLSIFLMHQ